MVQRTQTYKKTLYIRNKYLYNINFIQQDILVNSPNISQCPPQDLGSTLITHIEYVKDNALKIAIKTRKLQCVVLDLPYLVNNGLSYSP